MICTYHGCVEDAQHFSALGGFCTTHSPDPGVVLLDAALRRASWNQLSPEDQVRLAETSEAQREDLVRHLPSYQGRARPSEPDNIRWILALRRIALLSREETCIDPGHATTESTENDVVLCSTCTRAKRLASFDAITRRLFPPYVGP